MREKFRSRRPVDTFVPYKVLTVIALKMLLLYGAAFSPPIFALTADSCAKIVSGAFVQKVRDWWSARIEQHRLLDELRKEEERTKREFTNRKWLEGQYGNLEKVMMAMLQAGYDPAIADRIIRNRADIAAGVMESPNHYRAVTVFRNLRLGTWDDFDPHFVSAPGSDREGLIFVAEESPFTSFGNYTLELQVPKALLSRAPGSHMGSVIRSGDMPDVSVFLLKYSKSSDLGGGH